MGDNVSFSIRIGSSDGTGGEQRSAWGLWDPNDHLGDLTHVVTLSDGPGEEQKITLTGSQTGNFIAEAGTWNIDVKSYLEGANGILIAQANEQQDIYQGMSTIVIQMEAPDDFTVFTITFDLVYDVEPRSSTVHVPAGISINLPALERDDFELIGWYTLPEGEGYFYEQGFSFTPTASITLYAYWESTIPTFTVTYNANGGANNVPVDYNEYEAGDEVTVEVPSTDMTRDGFVFDRWNTAANGSGTNYAPDDTFPMLYNDVTLYAMWKSAPSFSISIDQITDPLASTNINVPAPINLREPDGIKISFVGEDFISFRWLTGGEIIDEDDLIYIEDPDGTNNFTFTPELLVKYGIDGIGTQTLSLEVVTTSGPYSKTVTITVVDEDPITT